MVRQTTARFNSKRGNTPHEHIVLGCIEQSPPVLDMDLSAYNVQVDLLHHLHPFDERVVVGADLVLQPPENQVLGHVDSTDLGAEELIQRLAVVGDTLLIGFALVGEQQGGRGKHTHDLLAVPTQRRLGQSPP